MNHTIKLLDTYRKVCSITTDLAVAAKLGVSRGAVSSWRHELRHAEPESVETMAKACGLDGDEWVLRVQADREAGVNPRRAQVWLRCAERLAAIAAGVAAVYLYGRLDVHAAMSAGALFIARNPGPMYIM